MQWKRVLVILMVAVFILVGVMPAGAVLPLIIGGVAIGEAAVALSCVLIVAAGAKFRSSEACQNAARDYLATAGDNIRSALTGARVATDSLGRQVAEVTDDVWSDMKTWISSKWGGYVGETEVVHNYSYFSLNGNMYKVYPFGTKATYAELDSAASIIDPDGNTISYNAPRTAYTDIFSLYLVKNGVNATYYTGTYEFPSRIVNYKFYYRYYSTTKVQLYVVCGNDLDGWKWFQAVSSGGFYTGAWDINADGSISSDYAIDLTADTTVADRDYSQTGKRGVVLPADEVYTDLTALDVQTTYDFDQATATPTPAVGGDYGDVLGNIRTGVDSLGAKAGAISTALEGIGNVIGGIREGVSSIGNTIALSLENFFKVDNLNFDGLKNLIVFDKFPFCIPFDLVHTVQLFAQSAQTPSFDIDIDTSYLQVNHHIDLSPYTFYIAFFRYFVVAVFIFFLVSKTSAFIKW